MGRDGWDRRQVLAAGALGGAGLLLPEAGWSQSGRAQRRQAAVPLAGFTHGVASGEPGPSSMLFWTRYEGRGQAVPLRLEVSPDPRMARARVVAEALAEPGRDWTARATVNGLTPGRTYYYRWLGPEKGERSMTGRTRTLPEGSPSAFSMGVFSCSNLPFGWFNGYGHAVAADDIDLFVHLGDYIYEYGRGTYPTAPAAVPGRTIEPAGELIGQADYWARYRSYRADPDLQALHANVASVTVWDDHEIANDAWMGGAENHEPRDGDWGARVAAAQAAYRDWMPVSDRPWARYDIGRLATLYRLDTRIAGRDRPLDVDRAIRAGPDTMTALKRLRDEAWIAGGRQMLGLEQEAWLFGEIRGAARRGVRWQVLAQQVVMGRLQMPPGASRLAGTSPEVASFLGAAELGARLGLPINLDAWDGYPAARARLLGSAQREGVDLVVLAGDSHNAWASDLLNDGRPAGVEFAGQSVSSPGYESYLKVPPSDVASLLVGGNPTLRWAETGRRGYMQVVLTPAEAVCEWRFSAPVASRSPKLSGMMRGRVQAGQRRLVMG